MASVNKAIIVGNLGKDPETRALPSGDSVCNFSVATTDKWKDKQTGEAKEATEWHRINTFGKLADICDQYLRKGSQVYIEGSLHTRKWTDKDGAEKYSTEIKAETMKMLGAKPDGQPQRPEAPRQAPARQAPASKPAPAGGVGWDGLGMDEDIPF